MMRRVAIAFLGLLLASFTAEARAELVIYAQDTQVSQGGYALMNIYVAGASTDAVSDYQVTLSIAPSPGTSGTVTFAPNGAAPDPGNVANGEQPYSYLGASDYIFAGDSTDATAGVNGGGYPVGYPSTYFTATDLTLSGAGYSPASANPPTPSAPGTLLASLLIHAVSVNPTGEFSVSLVSNGTLGNGDTFFFNPAGGLVSYDPTLGSTPGFSGSIKIHSSAVPEPLSIVSGLMALVMVGGAMRLRRRRTP